MPTNVLLIQVDQMHAGCLSTLGNPNVRTPNLDRLAGQGVHFTHAVCQNSICMPSRTSMLSGQYPSTNRQFGFSGRCRRDMPWLPLTFQSAGYRTAAYGKFHVTCIPEDRWGFDLAAPTLPEDEDLARPHGDHYRAYCQQQSVPWRTDQIHGHDLEDGERLPVIPSSAKPEMHWFERMACKSDVPLEHSLETWTTNRFLDFLDQQARSDEPFFAWLTYDRPHFPTTLPSPWFEHIRPDDIILPPLPSVDDMASWPRSMFELHARHTSIYNVGEHSLRFMLATYFTLIEWLDAEIGRVLDRLRERGLDDRTTIAFCSDHGDLAGWLGAYDKASRCVTDAVTRVPLIIRPAPVLGATTAGRRIDAPVELVDLFPTLCGLAGVESPHEIEGHDLGPALRTGTPPPADRPVFCEEFNRRMIERDGWRLVFYLDNDAENALFDLGRDPNCYRNVYADPAHQPRRIALKRDLLQFLVERADGSPTEADITLIRRSLDPADDHFPLLLRKYQGVHRYGGAVVVCHADRFLLVPLFEESMRLFDTAGRYRKDDRALPLDPAVVEPMLDFAVAECMRRVAEISPYETRRTTRQPVTRAEAQALAARLHRP